MNIISYYIQQFYLTRRINIYKKYFSTLNKNDSTYIRSIKKPKTLKLVNNIKVKTRIENTNSNKNKRKSSNNSKNNQKQEEEYNIIFDNFLKNKNLDKNGILKNKNNLIDDNESALKCLLEERIGKNESSSNFSIWELQNAEEIINEKEESKAISILLENLIRKSSNKISSCNNENLGKNNQSL